MTARAVHSNTEMSLNEGGSGSCGAAGIAC